MVGQNNNNNRIQVTKSAPPPPGLPVLAHSEPQDVSFLGRTNYVAALEEKRFIFGIKRGDRRQHVYVIGKSGIGKTRLHELLVRQDIAYGHGVCVIDPQGDLVDDLLDFIPKERIEDVCLIDPADESVSVSFNPLVNVDPHLRHQLAQAFVDLVAKQFSTNWNPRLEHVFRFTILALLDYPHATMRGIISLLTDKLYRQEVIRHIEDDMVRRFWEEEFEEWSEKFDTEAIFPLVNKLRQFLSNPTLRSLFEAEENKVNVFDLMQENKILLLNISRGRLGEENSNFLGSIFLAKIKEAGMLRAKLPAEERKDFYLYIDEFQNVITESFDTVISESHKYGFNLTISHQYLGQLSKKIQNAVLGHVGTLICFRVSGEDAVALKPEFAPVFDVKDMINLGVGEIYLKMTIDRQTYDPFSAELLKLLPAPYASSREAVIDASHRKYSL